MAIKEVSFNDHKYSEEVTQLTLDTYSSDNNRYGKKYNLTTSNGTYTRSMQIEDLVANVSSNDRYFVVPIEYQYDPYRIAQLFYADKDLYWVILAANRLLDPFDLEEGLSVRIPDISSIYGLNGLLTVTDGY